MDQIDDGSDVFADLNPLSSMMRQPSYMGSKAPVSVSLASLFSMDQALFNPPMIPMEPSTEQFLLQNPPLPVLDDTTLMASNLVTDKMMSAFRSPKMESLAPIDIPPARLPSSRNKRKSPSERSTTEKSTKSLSVTSPKYQAKSIKAQTESFDSVRSKLRDSLAAALTLSAVKEGPPVVGGLGDDLLQGNGLSWEADLGSAEKSAVLAVDIESELFRLFGGVNKKYKEKGRSLLFNLKDPNNPELRTRVNLGEITAERLCSMSAEELASKELSEWRMAKAEEFAHMVVLQEDVDLRRLVKKTHKGEVQVEVEDDTVSVEVAVGANSLPLVMAKVKDDKAKAAVNEKVNGDDVEDIQELVAEGKEAVAGALPAIVSLDEFMEALNSEPPFENMAADSSRTNSLPDAKVAENSLKSPILSKTDISESKKVNDGEKESVDFVPAAVSTEYMWEGSIQLTVSSAVTVQAYFKSGEKALTKDWPAVMEVKGRVRLEAFEKFLRDLPLSKSRAMMVIYFLWKEGSPEGGRNVISEAAESYAADERLGYVEPCPGVELYVCPPGGTTSKLVPAAGESPAPPDSLVGVVVWRRAFVQSPRPQKPSSKSKQLPPLSRKNPKNPPLQQQRKREEALVDDVPPGFGPPPSREEDDLPEFDFQKSSSSSSSSVFQMRELIHKYGSHTAPANPSRALWDDDDDIPEWKPQTLVPPLPPAAPPVPQAQFLPNAAGQPMAWPPYSFAAGDGRGAMDWRYDVNKSRGL